MKILYFYFISFILLFLQTTTNAKSEDSYIRASYANLRNSFLFTHSSSQKPSRIWLKDGYTLEVAVGKILIGDLANTPQISAEIMGLYEYRNAYDRFGDYENLKTYSGMLNTNLMFFDWHGFVPYMGVGVGFANNILKTQERLFSKRFDPESEIKDDSSLSFAWQWRAGLLYHFNKRFIGEVYYCSIHSGNSRTYYVVTQNINTHGLRAGLRFKI